MVMPLAHEDRPKCYLCHARLDTIEDLRGHIESEHGDAAPDSKRQPAREPAPGDVSVF